MARLVAPPVHEMMFNTPIAAYCQHGHKYGTMMLLEQGEWSRLQEALRRHKKENGEK